MATRLDQAGLPQERTCSSPVRGHPPRRARRRLVGRVGHGRGERRPGEQVAGVVVPEPVLARLEALDAAVPGGLRVRGGVLRRGRSRSSRCARTARSAAGAPTSRRPASHSAQPVPLGGTSRSMPSARSRVAAHVGLPDRWPARAGAGPERVSPGTEIDLEVAVVLVDHDPPGDVQAEPGALADRLGGEERLEDPVPDVLRDAGAGVADLDEQTVVVARRCGWSACPVAVHRLRRRCRSGWSTPG